MNFQSAQTNTIENPNRGFDKNSPYSPSRIIYRQKIAKDVEKATETIQTVAGSYVATVETVKDRTEHITEDCKAPIKSKLRRKKVELKKTKFVSFQEGQVDLEPEPQKHLYQHRSISGIKDSYGFISARFCQDMCLRLFDYEEYNSLLYLPKTPTISIDFANKEFSSPYIDLVRKFEESTHGRFVSDYTDFMDHFEPQQLMIDENVDVSRIVDADHWSFVENQQKPVQNKIKTKSKKEPLLIRFDEIIDMDDVLKPGNCLMSHEYIRERRHVSLIQQNDYTVTKEEIYKFFHLAGDVIDDMKCDRNFDFSFENDDLRPAARTKDGSDQNTTDSSNKKDESFKIDFEKHKMHTTPDIDLLKRELDVEISKNCGASIVDIYYNISNSQAYLGNVQKPDFYDCVLAIMHLAKEKNLEFIQGKDENVYINIL